jgi:hypothetical protein
MGFPNEVISVLNSYLPESYKIPDDRRQWWAVQICAHVALILVFTALVLCVNRWIPDSDLNFDRQSVLDSLDVIVPGLIAIQAYYVPIYYRYLEGKDRLWKFFGGTFLSAIIGLLFYPIYVHFLAEVWAQIMLIITLAISGLMFAEALLMHLLFKWWSARKKPKGDLLPPLSGRL